jgi:hypothetical protein
MQGTSHGGATPGNWGSMPLPNSGGTMSLKGCAVTLAANISFTEGQTAVTPGTIAQSNNNFSGTSLRWGEALSGSNLTISPLVEGQLSAARFNELNNETAEHYIGIRVNYTGDADDHHWVGASNIVTRDGSQFYQISRTSQFDDVLNTTATNNRGGMNWQVEEGNIYVPLNAVTGYRVFTKSTTNGVNDE